LNLLVYLKSPQFNDWTHHCEIRSIWTKKARDLIKSGELRSIKYRGCRLNDFDKDNLKYIKENIS
jgi:hypothetical protein